MNVRIIQSVILVACMIFFTSCGNSSKLSTAEDTNEERPNTMTDTQIPRYDSDFYAFGDKEEWKLEVRYMGGIVFQNAKNNITFFTTQKPNKTVAQGANVIGIYDETNEYVIQINIDVVDCGKEGKEVNIMVRRKSDNKEFDFAGCGIYRGTSQLHDIWVLEKLNGEQLRAEQFPKEFPHFEFNLVDRTMSGFAGCNQVNGNISFDYNRIKIEPLISTRMYCSEVSEIESKILNILRNNPVYSLKELHLYIETTEGSLVLKKVD